MVHSLNKKLFFKIYQKACLIRTVEEKISYEYSKGEMRCPTHLSLGQEIAPSILASFLNNKDLSISTHRNHAHYLSKGGDLFKMIAEIYGKKEGCSKGVGGSMHLIDTSVGFMGTSAIVGSSIPIGLGLALNLKLNNSKNIAIAFFGDGAREEGSFYESINLSIVKKLPLMFFCENNYYSVYSPLSVRQPNIKPMKYLSSLGIKTYHSNGKNFKDMINKINSAVSYIKNSQKPCYLEIDCYRTVEHCGPNKDDQLGYRDKKDFKMWKNIDSFSDFEKFILEKKFLKPNEIYKVKKNILSKVNLTFNKVKNFKNISSQPKYKDLFI